MLTTRKMFDKVLSILKKRFNNLTAEEASKITFDIVEAVELIIYDEPEKVKLEVNEK